MTTDDTSRPDEVPGGSDTGGRVERRRFLAGLAAGSVLVAGCSGSDDGSETTTDGGGDEATDEPPASRTSTADGGDRDGEPTETGTPADDPEPDVREWDDDLTRQMEYVDRGVVAYPVDDGILVRWRLFATEPRDVGFHLYRDGDRVTDEPLTGGTNYLDEDGTTDAAYSVAPVEDGSEGERSKSVEAWDREYKRIPLDPPAERTDRQGDRVTYHANDAAVADLTGDGSYDLVLKWSPSNSKDNAHEGHTSNVYLDGITLDGEQLWRFDLGPNVRAGAHYTPFQVYDYDGDGTPEVAVRTSDGATDAAGRVLGDPDAYHANEGDGRIVDQPEFLTVVDGETGEILDNVDFKPARGDLADWGDDWGNRGYRFLAGSAYLDGERPSIVMGRGYYEKTMLTAWDFRDGAITERWTFDSTDGNRAYEAQGNHQLSVVDVDYDGKDEIVYGSCVIDHDGTGLYSTGWNHGDALHVSDFVPSRPGQEVYQPHEWGPHGATLRDAETGERLWSEAADADVGRAMIADIDPNYPGAELWASHGVGFWTNDGQRLGRELPSLNFGIWWTGDLHRELLDHDWNGDREYGVGKIETWDPERERLERLVTFDGTRSNNHTKGNPCISGDILGDWREEVIWREPDSEALRLYATPHTTEHRIPTLVQDPQYRLALAWQNVAYNQPPWPSFFIGHDMPEPRDPDIEIVDPDD